MPGCFAISKGFWELKDRIVRAFRLQDTLEFKPLLSAISTSLACRQLNQFELHSRQVEKRKRSSAGINIRFTIR